MDIYIVKRVHWATKIKIAKYHLPIPYLNFHLHEKYIVDFNFEKINIVVKLVILIWKSYRVEFFEHLCVRLMYNL